MRETMVSGVDEEGGYGAWGSVLEAVCACYAAPYLFGKTVPHGLVTHTHTHTHTYLLSLSLCVCVCAPLTLVRRIGWGVRGSGMASWVCKWDSVEL